MTTAPSRPRTTSDLLLEWDRRRPRSRQRQFGMSELGGCRRRAGYRLAGTEPTNASGSVQAVMGTAVHEAVADVLRAQAEPGDLVEHEVSFAGILGHLDSYHDGTVVDVKTTTSRWLKHLKLHGPDRSHLWQVHGYGAALVAEGREVREVGIDYLARDTGEEWTWRGPFNTAVLRDALRWVAEVRAADVEMLPREYEPDSAFCRGCPFLDACWGETPAGRDPRVVLYREDPDAAGWAAKLWAAKADRIAAGKREAEAKGALDALRPEDGEVVDVGFDVALEWVRVAGRHTPDRDVIEADYRAAGQAMPLKTGDETWRLGFAPKGES